VSIVALALGMERTPRCLAGEAFLLHPARLKTPIASCAGRRAATKNIDMNGIAPATFFDWRKEAALFERACGLLWG